MIVCRTESDLVLVTQSDHAHLAAEVVGLWRHPDLIDHPRRRALLRAIRLHDNGWREADSAPRVDADTGSPLDFTAIPDELRAEIWRRGILRYSEEDPYVALLVLRHARALHREPPEPVARLLEEMEEAAEPWREAAGVSPSEIESDYPWIALGDTLSLVAASRWEQSRSVGGYELRWSDHRVLVEPFPLAGVTRFRLSARRILSRPYRSDRDLAVELATARWERLDVRVAPKD